MGLNPDADGAMRSMAKRIESPSPGGVARRLNLLRGAAILRVSAFLRCGLAVRSSYRSRPTEVPSQPRDLVRGYTKRTDSGPWAA